MENKLKTTAKRTAILGLCVSCALILSYVELLIPPITVAVPGIKMGLANVMTVFVLYRFGIKSAAAVSGGRIILSTLLFGSAVSFVYSFLGGVLSLVAMWGLVKIDKLSHVGVSAVGGVIHNAGQIIGAVILMGSGKIAYYFPVLAISGTISGIFVGLLGAIMLKNLRNVKLY